MEASKEEKQVMVSSRRPLLAISGRGDYRGWRNFYNVSTKQCSTELIPELTNKHIRFCSYGWLLLQDRANSVDFCLYHFESNEMVKLPSLDTQLDSLLYYSFDGFMFLPPNHPDCRVVLFDWRGSLWICKPGDDKFVKQDIGAEGLRHPSFIDLQGQPYCFLSNSYSIVRLSRIEFVGSEIVFLDLIEMSVDQFKFPMAIDTPRYYLAASNNDVLLIIRMSFGFEFEVDGFRVYRMDFEKRKWTRMRSIGEMAIFVTHQHRIGTSCVAAEYGVEPNTIYFTQKDSDKYLYMFRLEDQSTTMTLPCSTLSRFFAKFEWIIL